MRWEEKPYGSPEQGTERTITRFLWFPMKINKETRWLETATYTERYFRPSYIGSNGHRVTFDGPGGFWSDRKWINQKVENGQWT